MTGKEDTNVEWVERDQRRWMPLAPMPDMLTARMFVTMLESNELEGRVGTQGGKFTIEVPEEHYMNALQLYQPGDSGVHPPLEEARQKTGIHTGHRIKQEMATRALERRDNEKTGLPGWLIAVILAVLALGAISATVFFVALAG